MTPYRSAIRHLSLTSAMVLLSVASAHALDTEAFGNRLKAYMTEQGAEIRKVITSQWTVSEAEESRMDA